MSKAMGAAIATALVLAGCGSKTDANEKNFGAAIGQYLDKKGDLCLGLSRWPVDLDPREVAKPDSPTGNAKRMAVLEAAGLVKSEDAQAPASPWAMLPAGTQVKVRRYTLTDAAKPFERSQEAKSVGLNGPTTETVTDLCWGKMTLDKIVKWEGPMKLGDYQEASVKYLYKITGEADWAKNPDIQAAFPRIAGVRERAGKKEDTHGVKLTSIGWEALGLDN